MERAGAGVRVVPSDAVATATAILAHESSYRLGIALRLLSIVCYIGVAALFSRLFRPVNRYVSLVALLFALVRIAIWACSTFFILAVVILLQGSPYLSVFDRGQVQVLALTFLILSTQAYSIGFVFEGVFWIAIGFLWSRSTFLPRIVGALFACTGLSYLTFLSLPLANALLLQIGVFSGIAELSMELWLLVRGVDAQRWEDVAGRAGILGPLPTQQRSVRDTAARLETTPLEAQGWTRRSAAGSVRSILAARPYPIGMPRLATTAITDAIALEALERVAPSPRSAACSWQRPGPIAEKP